MDSIAYVGLDVHKNTHTVCVYFPESDEIKRKVTIFAHSTELLYFNKDLVNDFPDTKFVYGYEAGCLGYSLFHYLQDYGIECKILAPHSIPNFGNKKVKTDRRDCENVAKALAFNLGKYVHIPTDKEAEIKEFLRMRNAHKTHHKKIKQQIQSLVLRLGKRYDPNKRPWTIKYMEWLKNLELSNRYRITLDEFVSSYYYLDEKIKRLDSEIEEISKSEWCKEKVDRLKCIKGIRTHTALSIVAEIGDFSRFEKASQFASYIGLVPAEHSSGDKVIKSSITRTGNSRTRLLLVEAAQCHTRGNPVYKSKALERRQRECSHEVIEQADKINAYLGKRYFKLIDRGLIRNKAVTAIARSLACSIWFLLKDL